MYFQSQSPGTKAGQESQAAAKDSFINGSQPRGCISDVYTVIQSSSKITVTKQQLNNFMVGGFATTRRTVLKGIKEVLRRLRASPLNDL